MFTFISFTENESLMAFFSFKISIVINLSYSSIVLNNAEYGDLVANRYIIYFLKGSEKEGYFGRL